MTERNALARMPERRREIERLAWTMANARRHTVLLFGSEASGKTMVAGAALNRVSSSSSSSSSRVVDVPLSVVCNGSLEDLCGSICAGLGGSFACHCKSVPAVATHIARMSMTAEGSPSKRRTVIVIDDAESLLPEELEWASRIPEEAEFASPTLEIVVVLVFRGFPHQIAGVTASHVEMFPLRPYSVAEAVHIAAGMLDECLARSGTGVPVEYDSAALVEHVSHVVAGNSEMNVRRLLAASLRFFEGGYADIIGRHSGSKGKLEASKFVTKQLQSGELAWEIDGDKGCCVSAGEAGGMSEEMKRTVVAAFIAAHTAPSRDGQLIGSTTAKSTTTRHRRAATTSSAGGSKADEEVEARGFTIARMLRIKRAIFSMDEEERKFPHSVADSEIFAIVGLIESRILVTVRDTTANSAASSSSRSVPSSQRVPLFIGTTLRCLASRNFAISAGLSLHQRYDITEVISTAPV